MKELRQEKSDPSDTVSNLADAAAFLAQTVAQINADGLGPLNKALAVINRHWSTMSPGAKTATINRIRALMVHAASLPDLKARYQDAKRRLFGSYEDADPVETIFAANKAILAAANTKTLAEIEAAIKVLRDNEHLLPPPPPPGP